VIEKEAPGLTFVMLQESLKVRTTFASYLLHPMLEAPTLGGVGGGFSRAGLTPAIIAERPLKPRSSWHQWDDFTTVPGLPSFVSYLRAIIFKYPTVMQYSWLFQ
jgi:hypothetical protein